MAKLLAASSKYSEALETCLYTLKALGEDFPDIISLPSVLNELSVLKSSLENIDSVEKVKQLPQMTDKSKLNSMHFLSSMQIYCVISKPLLMPLISARMVRLTIDSGFCDDSIIGIVASAWTLVSEFEII